MALNNMNIVLAVVSLIIAMVVQTLAIGYFVGGVKQVVERLVKDVEQIIGNLTATIKDLLLARKDIEQILGHIKKHDERLDHAENKINKLEDHKNHRHLS